jgi:hypothetical protein
MWLLDFPHHNISKFIGQHFPWPVERSIKWPALLFERTLIEAGICIPVAIVLALRLRRFAVVTPDNEKWSGLGIEPKPCDLIFLDKPVRYVGRVRPRVIREHRLYPSPGNPFLHHGLLRYAHPMGTATAGTKLRRRGGMWKKNSPNEGDGMHAPSGA